MAIAIIARAAARSLSQTNPAERTLPFRLRRASEGEADICERSGIGTAESEHDPRALEDGSGPASPSLSPTSCPATTLG